MKEQKRLVGLLTERLEGVYKIKNGFRVLQIGANDGKQFDPIYKYIKAHNNIKCVFIEPLIEYFSALVNNYKEKTESIFLNVGISDFDGLTNIRFVDPKAVSDGLVPPWAAGIGTVECMRNAIDGVGLSAGVDVDFSKITINRTIPVLALNTLLNLPFCRDIDVYVSDCEGHDAKIFLSANRDLFKPSIIFMESMLMNEVELCAVQERLISWGYTVEDDGVDLLAYIP